MRPADSAALCGTLRYSATGTDACLGKVSSDQHDLAVRARDKDVVVRRMCHHACSGPTPQAALLLRVVRRSVRGAPRVPQAMRGPTRRGLSIRRLVNAWQGWIPRRAIREFQDLGRDIDAVLDALQPTGRAARTCSLRPRAVLSVPDGP